MRGKMIQLCVFLGVILFFLSPLWGAARVKPEAAAKGYLYEPSHDEIVAKAKKEGMVRALVGSDPATTKATQDAFMKKYPFLNCYLEEITGTDNERFLLELQSGQVADWDLIFLQSENYNFLRPFVEKVDFLSMASQKILTIPNGMVSPVDRNALGVAAIADLAVYNSKLLKADAVPKTWEGFLKPELKGRKFVLDVKPNYLAGLVPLKGMEWTQDYARKLAAQDPIWVRGQTRALTAMAVGEYSLQLGTYYHSLMRARKKGMTNLEPVFLDPVSVRLSEVYGVRKGAKRPYAAILLMEFLASPEGQKIRDYHDPGNASVFAPGSMLEQAIAGRTLSILDWDHFDKRDKYVDEIVKAYGFPTAGKDKDKKK